MLDVQKKDKAGATPAAEAEGKPPLLPVGAWQTAGRNLLPGKPISPADMPDYTVKRDDLAEIYAAAFLRRLKALNAFVKQAGERLEGGIFYWHGDAAYHDSPPAADLAPARRNLWRAARFKRSMLEIGVNAGHSALLALSANPRLVYTGIDLGVHRYTEQCVAYLAAEFPGRVRYLQGDSRDVLPQLAARRDAWDFDLYHVDGGHTDDVCRTDVGNCLTIAEGGRGRHLLLDDINASWIFDVYCEFVAAGRLATETFFGDWEDVNRNVLARIL
ncbi:MAG TPA: class I SAM-dependent methyltransferase [Roseiarcus sp.]|nr:class I SAM-dependent methyltransferase [Roseiarcus sp.]